MAKTTRRRNAKTEVSNALDTMDVRSFMEENDFIQVHGEVRENTNGYPYITFITSENKADNIYFSKNAAEEYGEGDKIQKGFFDDLIIVSYLNEAGEKRVKIGTLANSQRAEMGDLF